MRYRDYDQQALDDQYNARKACPEADDYIASWAARSRRAREGMAGHLDVAFGSRPEERLDIFAADGRAAPGLVFLHGGYWRAFGKDDFSFVAEGFVPSGVAVAVVNYALAPAVTVDEIVRECRAALAWLHRHGAEHGLDPERLHVAGHSAGGHLTAMMLATDWPAFEPGLAPDVVKSGCAISGVFDLEPIRLSYLNEEVRLDPEMARRNSPIHLIPERAPPLVLSVGGAESDEFHRQAREYAARWRQAGLALEEVAMAGMDHFAIMDAFADPESALTRAVRSRILA